MNGASCTLSPLPSAGKVKATISAAMFSPTASFTIERCFLSLARDTWNIFSHLHGTCTLRMCFLLLTYCCSRVRNLFHDMDRLALMAREWSAGISMGRQASCKSCLCSCWESTPSSSSSPMPSVSLSPCTCCTQRCTVRSLASEVETIAVATGRRLRG